MLPLISSLSVFLYPLTLSYLHLLFQGKASNYYTIPLSTLLLLELFRLELAKGASMIWETEVNQWSLPSESLWLQRVRKTQRYLVNFTSTSLSSTLCLVFLNCCTSATQILIWNPWLQTHGMQFWIQFRYQFNISQLLTDFLSI